MSRNYVAGEAVRGITLFNERIVLRTMELGVELQGRIKYDQKYIFEHGAGESRGPLGVVLEFVCLCICFCIDPAGTYGIPAFN